LFHGQEGAKFVINNATVTINGDIDSGLYQIFDCSDNGTIALNSKAIKKLYPEWWGDNGDVSMTALLLEDAIDICNINYQWNESSAGTDEYYLQLIGGGDPKIGQPWTINENDSELYYGEVNSLAKGEWGYGDPGLKLGYSTIVVRLSDGNMPDPANRPGGFLNFQAGCRFSYYPDHAKKFYLKDCRIENHNKDYNFIYTTYYNTSSFKLCIKDSDFNHKCNINPFKNLLLNLVFL